MNGLAVSLSRLWSLPSLSRRDHHYLGDEHLPGFSQGPIFRRLARPATAVRASRPNWKRFSPPVSPSCGALVEAPDGSLYAGTGHRGRVYRIDPCGRRRAGLDCRMSRKSSPSRSIRAASSMPPARPTARFTASKMEKRRSSSRPRRNTSGRSRFAKDGSLLVGTGDPGNIYRVDKAGKSELYYETGQSHVTALAFDANGNVLAGTEPNGILYRISAKDKAFVLYNASLPEIRSIVPMPDGTVYAAALGGSVANRTTPVLPGVSSARSSRSPRLEHPSPFLIRTRRPDTDLKPKAVRATGSHAGGPASRRRERTHRNSRRREVGASTRSIPIPPLKRCGARKTKTCTAWRSSRTARSCSPQIHKAAFTGSGRIARRRWWWRPTKAKRRGCWRLPPA